MKKTLSKPRARSKAPASMEAVAQVQPVATKTALVLRTCAVDLTSHGGFRWPKSGFVKCDDWNKEPHCGNGLHGLLWGEGDGSLLDWSADARWLVVSVDADLIVSLGGKVKFPHGDVVFCGDRQGATEYILANGAAGKKVVGAAATAGDEGTATAGYAGTATAGYAGTATAGDEGTATAGDRGTATAGYAGTATAGDRGTATAGYAGTATAGDEGKVKAGKSAILMGRCWDSKANRWRLVIGYVGEDGIKPDTTYKIFSGFAAVNRARCEHPSGFNHALDSWSLSDWITATTGELGEAANIAKKLNRVRDGIPGNKESADELRTAFKKEIADVFIYLDLVAQSQGFSLEEAVREKFNETSAKIGALHTV